jgi:lysyl-tRNA synthetase class 1
MPPDIVVPSAIETVIHDYDHSELSFTALDVQQALGKARRSLQNPSEAENLGAWVEILAFSLTDGRDYAGASPWGTFFCPMGSGTDKDGQSRYFPDIAGADAQVITYWSGRAKTVSHPVLKARYADSAWDMCTVISGTRRDPEMARLAIDSYLASVAVISELHDRFTAALRALDLASLIQDRERVELARAALLQLHREAMDGRQGLWWFAVDRLITDKNVGVTEEERQQLIADLEELVIYFGDTGTPNSFNPHALQDAAKRLIRHYTRLHRSSDVKRLHEAIARAFEHFAGLGNAMLASAVLQTSVNAYRDAGLSEDSKRARILMQEKIGQAHENMGTIESEIRLPRDHIEEFLQAIVAGDLGSTFVRITGNFLPTRNLLEKAVQKSLKQTPLMALMPQTIMVGDHVAAKVGSVLDDPLGRLIGQTTMDLGFSGIWLQEALEQTIEVHEATPEHFVSWANRLGLFDNLTFLIEGVRAWYEGDLIKAVHVLVPQVEKGLRSIVAQLGKPVTKPHPSIAGVSVSINMGDILYSKELADLLGPDVTLYFLALYADPRGMNLRNRVAHGQLESVTGSLVQLVIHTLLVFGVWKELAERRR